MITVFNKTITVSNTYRYGFSLAQLDNKTPFAAILSNYVVLIRLVGADYYWFGFYDDDLNKVTIDGTFSLLIFAI